MAMLNNQMVHDKSVSLFADVSMVWATWYPSLSYTIRIHKDRQQEWGQYGQQPLQQLDAIGGNQGVVQISVLKQDFFRDLSVGFQEKDNKFDSTIFTTLNRSMPQERCTLQSIKTSHQIVSSSKPL